MTENLNQTKFIFSLRQVQTTSNRTRSRCNLLYLREVVRNSEVILIIIEFVRSEIIRLTFEIICLRLINRPPKN